VRQSDHMLPARLAAEDAYRRGVVHGVHGLREFLVRRGLAVYHDEIAGEFMRHAQRMRNDPTGEFNLEAVTAAAAADVRARLAMPGMTD